MKAKDEEPKWPHVAAMINEIRTVNQLTREEFGEMLGVSKQFIRKLETGESPISIDLAKKIAAQGFTDLSILADCMADDVRRSFTE